MCVCTPAALPINVEWVWRICGGVTIFYKEHAGGDVLISGGSGGGSIGDGGSGDINYVTEYNDYENDDDA